MPEFKISRRRVPRSERVVDADEWRDSVAQAVRVEAEGQIHIEQQPAEQVGLDAERAVQF